MKLILSVCVLYSLSINIVSGVVEMNSTSMNSMMDTKTSDKDSRRRSKPDIVFDKLGRVLALTRRSRKYDVNGMYIGGRGTIQLCSSYSEEPCFVYDRSSPIGPYCWGIINGASSRCCDSSAAYQSPISIPRTNKKKYIRQALRYDTSSITGFLENNGIYPKFLTNGRKEIKLRGIPNSKYAYVLDNIHIHTGVRGAYRQTENLLYGKSFDAEVHIVHHREDFKDLTEAKLVPGGIAVVSIFLTTKRSRRARRSEAIDALIERIPEIKDFTEENHVCTNENQRIRREGIYSKLGVERLCRDNKPTFDSDDGEAPKTNCLLHTKGNGCGQVVKDITFDPNDLLSSIPEYLTFHGGLTTPSCSEAVRWLVAENPTYVSSIKTDRLRSRIVNRTISDDGNLRPLQDPAGRFVAKVIYRSRRYYNRPGYRPDDNGDNNGGRKNSVDEKNGGDNGGDYNGGDYNGDGNNGGDYNGGDYNGGGNYGVDYNGGDYNGVDNNGGYFNGEDYNGEDYNDDSDSDSYEDSDEN